MTNMCLRVAELLQVSIEVNHCLLVGPGVQKKDVRRVISHYQALAQVENYVRKMPGVTREAVDDTAGAAKMIAQEGWRCSSVCHSLFWSQHLVAGDDMFDPCN